MFPPGLADDRAGETIPFTSSINNLTRQRHVTCANGAKQRKIGGNFVKTVDD